jgi:hypothetical protein
MEAGVPKASMEETAGGVCAGGGVGLWGFRARVGFDFSVSDWVGVRANAATVASVAPDAKGGVMSRWAICVFGGGRRRRGLPSVERGRYRRDIGVGRTQRWRVATRACWS